MGISENRRLTDMKYLYLHLLGQYLLRSIIVILYDAWMFF